MGRAGDNVMKNLLAALLLIATLTGCAAFSKPEAVAGCQVADAVTTIIALKAGAVEANPLVAGVISSAGYGGLIVLKLLVTLLLLSVADDAPEAVGAVSIATCAVAAHNVLFF